MTDFDSTLDAWVFEDYENPLPEEEFLSDSDDDQLEVDDWAPGETTLQERNARILARDAETRQTDRFEAVAPDVLDADGHDRFDATDAAMVRLALAEVAAEAGIDWLDLIAPLPAGNLSAANRARRDVLARAVAEARERGATVHVVATVTRRPLSTVHVLEERGRRLLEADAANPKTVL